MCRTKIALMGHSGAGKSACLLQLGIDQNRADMDVALGAQCSPPLVTALQWLTDGTQGEGLVVISNHEEMLKTMQRAKANGEFPNYFNRLCLVYLWKPKGRLARHLARPNSGCHLRDHPSQRYTLDNYDRFHVMYQSMADRVISVGDKSVQAVATEVKAFCVEIVSSGRETAALRASHRAAVSEVSDP